MSRSLLIREELFNVSIQKWSSAGSGEAKRKHVHRRPYFQVIDGDVTGTGNSWWMWVDYGGPKHSGNGLVNIRGVTYVLSIVQCLSISENLTVHLKRSTYWNQAIKWWRIGIYARSITYAVLLSGIYCCRCVGAVDTEESAAGRQTYPRDGEVSYISLPMELILKRFHATTTSQLCPPPLPNWKQYTEGAKRQYFNQCLKH